MILVAVYIPPVLTPTASCDIIHSALDCLQIQHLTAFLTAKNRDQNRRATDRENKDNDRRKLGRRPQQISMRVVSSGMKTVIQAIQQQRRWGWWAEFVLQQIQHCNYCSSPDLAVVGLQSTDMTLPIPVCPHGTTASRDSPDAHLSFSLITKFRDKWKHSTQASLQDQTGWVSVSSKPAPPALCNRP